MAEQDLASDDFTYLQYGSVVSISDAFNPTSFMYTDGFIKAEKVKLKKIVKVDFRSSFSKCLFKIYPIFSNISKNHVYEFEEQQAKNNSTNHENHEEEKKKSYATSKVISELQDKILGEFKSNKEIVEKYKNHPVLFGQTIQLLHVASNKFLSCGEKQSILEPQNFSLTLQSYPNDYSAFKIMPTLKHQFTNDKHIHLKDMVYITSEVRIETKIPYLHISDPLKIKVTKIGLPNFQDEDIIKPSLQKNAKKGDKKRAVLKPIIKGGQSATQKHSDDKQNLIYPMTKTKIEFNASLENKNKFKLNLFSEHIEDESEFICCGDIVWLNYFELSSCLVANRSISNGTAEYNLIFEMSQIMDSYMQYQVTSNGMWIIEHSDFKKGGLIKFGSSYRLKHLSSGKYMSIKSDNANSRLITLCLVDSGSEIESLFLFEPIESIENNQNSNSDNCVPRDTFVLMRSFKTKLVVSAIFRKDFMQATDNKNIDPDKGNLFEQGLPGLKASVSEQEAFKIIKSHFNEIWETNFLISCFPILKGFLCDLIISNEVYFLYL